MKKRSSTVLILLFAGSALVAQQDETLFGNGGLRLTGAWGGFGIGLTGFGGEGAVFSSGFGALEFNKTVLVGLGGSETSESVNFSGGKFDLEYGGFLVGFLPNAHRVVHPKFTFLLGGGEVKVKNEAADNVFVVQPGAGIEINVFRWFRFGVEGGYRFVSNSDLGALPDKDLSAFFGQMRFRFGWLWGK